MICGLLGRKLGHSYSPQIHQELGGYAYQLFEKEPEELEDFLRHGGFSGVNVTIPYKKDVISLLDELSPTARDIGSVNTILRRPDGSLYGHNTDYYGFTSLVRKSGVSVNGKKVLVLGSGGTSNMAVKALENLGARVIVISRKGPNHYGNLELHQNAAVIVNTTPVGMYPNTGAAPLNLKGFPRLEGVLDVVYNPARTQLLLEAEALGLPHENGLWMLVAQAKEAAECFTGHSICDSEIARIHHKLSGQMQNIVLIGMPGCGKSTIASLLAEKLGRKLVDLDAEVEAAAGKSIPEIFAQEGEDAFRDWETKVLEHYGKQSSLILPTGGGCVTRQRNYPLLHQNGTIFWLKRNLSLLPTEGRPLSQRSRVQDLYAVRKSLYSAFADEVVDNNGTLEETLRQILSYLEAQP